MQTFLPWPDFEASARDLDGLRLRNQVNEAKVILNTVTGVSDAWKHHPAVKMWEGYSDALRLYRWICQYVVVHRFKLDPLIEPMPPIDVEMPWWFGDERLHRSHRRNLLRKDVHHYSRIFYYDTPGDTYFWPYRGQWREKQVGSRNDVKRS